MQLDVILMPSGYPHWTSSDAPAAVDRDSRDLPAWMHHRFSPEKQKQSQQENSNCEWALAKSSTRAMQKTCFSVPLLKRMNQTIQIHRGVCFAILVLRSETEVQDSKSGLLVLTNLNWKKCGAVKFIEEKFGTTQSVNKVDQTKIETNPSLNADNSELHLFKFFIISCQRQRIPKK